MFRNGVLRFSICGVLLLTLLEGCVASSNEQELGSHQGGSTSAGGGSAQTCGNPEVHVFGVYEASGDHTSTGKATVHVERTGSQVLVLSSYESVHWKVSAVPGADLQYILVLGYDAQSVDAPPGVEVKVLDNETRGFIPECGYEYPDDDPYSGCETPDLLAQVKQLTGQDVSSFHGCYQATSFTLRGDLSADS
ncbi:hypothetical protein, partial [Pyxidicoccus trucidator]|uniref:hypothetical protein n=1 Tax=Pyxidicoccus trucidator TaxID=2709662 RepID=UPI0019683CF3